MRARVCTRAHAHTRAGRQKHGPAQACPRARTAAPPEPARRHSAHRQLHLGAADWYPGVIWKPVFLCALCHVARAPAAATRGGVRARAVAWAVTASVTAGKHPQPPGSCHTRRTGDASTPVCAWQVAHCVRCRQMACASLTPLKAGGAPCGAWGVLPCGCNAGGGNDAATATFTVGACRGIHEYRCNRHRIRSNYTKFTFGCTG